MSIESPAGGKRARVVGGDLLIPLMALAFAAYFFTDIGDLDWEAAANGIVVGTLLVALCVLQVTITLLARFRGEATLGLGRLIEPTDKLWQRIGLVAALSAFVWCLSWTGVTLGIYLVMLALLLLLGVREKLGLALVPVGVAATVYLLFVVLLKAKLPQGPVERLLGPMLGLGG